MLEKIISSVILNLANKALQWALDYFNYLKEKKKMQDDIDSRLEDLKKATTEAYDGTPKTPEQKEHLKQAIINFIRGGNGGL